VFSGLFLQLVLAFLVLRWSAGSRAVRYAGDTVVQFLGYSDKGAAFVYGDFQSHEFAFQVWCHRCGDLCMFYQRNKL